MINRFNKISILFFIALSFLAGGCMHFTQHDYDLQEKAYQKEQKDKEEAAKDTFQHRW